MNIAPVPIITQDVCWFCAFSRYAMRQIQNRYRHMESRCAWSGRFISPRQPGCHLFKLGGLSC